MEHFAEFNRRSNGDSAVSALRVLMDQHDPQVADLPEIGVILWCRKYLRNVIDVLARKYRNTLLSFVRGLISAPRFSSRFNFP